MGDEGGYSPKTETIEEPFQLLNSVISDDEFIAIDSAASEFYKIASNLVTGNYEIFGREYSSDELVQVYLDLVEKYNLRSIEDPFDENDLDSFTKLVEITKARELEVLVAGDDLTTTNSESILDNATNRRANAVIIKPNQIGTLTEVYNAVRLARGAGWKIICSHRSGETMDDFIVDLAVGIGAYGIKAGSPSQDVRRVKYERLQEIEKELQLSH